MPVFVLFKNQNIIDTTTTVTTNPSIAETVIEAGLDSSVIPTIEGRNFSVTDIVDGGAGAGGIEKYGEFKRTYNWPYDFFNF